MRRVLIILGCCLSVALGAGAAILAFPEITEKIITWTCDDHRPSDRCLLRMRAMGHIWSRKKDLARAEYWYAKSASHGDIESFFHLGWIFQHRAVEAAADEGGSLISHADFQPNYDHSQALFAKAKNAYRTAANAGFAPAINNFGELLGQQHIDAPQNPTADEDRFEWILRAANAGNPVAAINVSIAYMSGRGVGAHNGEAARWSRWTPGMGNARDLDSPTLERTSLFGSPIAREFAARIRHAAESNEPFVANFQPLQPDPRAPTLVGTSNN